MNGTKYLLLLGGFIAFSITFFVTFISGNPMSDVLMRSTLGCLIGLFLTKYLVKVLVVGLHESRLAKKEAERLEEQELDEEDRKKEPTPSEKAPSTS